jgi:XRCC1 N terminal domain
MRKRIVGAAFPAPESGPIWLDLENIATVEISSEEPGYPVESVFVSGAHPGWRAQDPGEQKLRVIFDEPRPIHVIELHFTESQCERTQEFRLGWESAEGGQTREIVRQQWNFSPHGAVQQVERYDVNLERVSTVELSINPDIANPNAKATLLKWRMR